MRSQHSKHPGPSDILLPLPGGKGPHLPPTAGPPSARSRTSAAAAAPPSATWTRSGARGWLSPALPDIQNAAPEAVRGRRFLRQGGEQLLQLLPG